MTCKICAISSRKVIDAIEQALQAGSGCLDAQAKQKLAEMFPDYSKQIKELDDQTCSMHFNFHQHIARDPLGSLDLPSANVANVANAVNAANLAKNLAGTGTLSLADAPLSIEPASVEAAERCQVQPARLVDQLKLDETEILYELLNMQAATMTVLSNKINEEFAKKDDEHQARMLLINPETRQFYADLGNSIRATVKEIRETHLAMNGEKDSAVDGLKAIAAAIHGTNQPKQPTDPNQSNQPVDDMTTKAFDN